MSVPGSRASGRGRGRAPPSRRPRCLSGVLGDRVDLSVLAQEETDGLTADHVGHLGQRVICSQFLLWAQGHTAFQTPSTP